MPPKVQPKTYILPVKTHKLTFFVTAPQTSTVASLKSEVLSALQAPVLLSPTPFNPASMDLDTSGDHENEWELPKVVAESDFELCKAVKDKGRWTGKYERLDGKATVKTAVVNWETLYVQFRDMERGIFQPVKVSIPSLLDDEEDEIPQPAEEEAPMSAVRKGKRKARPESPMSDILDD